MRVRSTVFDMSIDPQDTYRSVVVAILFSGITLLRDVAAGILIQQVLFRLWFLL